MTAMSEMPGSVNQAMPFTNAPLLEVEITRRFEKSPLLDLAFIVSLAERIGGEYQGIRDIPEARGTLFDPNLKQQLSITPFEMMNFEKGFVISLRPDTFSVRWTKVGQNQYCGFEQLAAEAARLSQSLAQIDDEAVKFSTTNITYVNRIGALRHGNIVTPKVPIFSPEFSWGDQPPGRFLTSLQINVSEPGGMDMILALQLMSGGDSESPWFALKTVGGAFVGEKSVEEREELIRAELLKRFLSIVSEDLKNEFGYTAQ